MESFRPWRGGYLAKADATERKFFAGLASDVAHMLGRPFDRMPEAPSRPRHAERDPLEAYEAELAGLGDDAPVFASTMDEAFVRLMPDMSEDPDAAASLRAMTQDGVASVKSSHLLVFYRSVTASTDDVWVGEDDMRAWISAVNSIRIVCASRLGIDDDARAGEIYEKAQELTGMAGGSGREIDNTDDLLAVLYTMLTWWQESLLAAVRNKRLRG
ncbi:MAG: DUF2017 family protein [Actinomycetaceae bacterium]|nr:DUF2017 family protein [Actinomycetaceae bacterium]